MQEGERILQKLGPTDLVVVLDQRGEQVSSERLAGFIDQERNRGTKQIDFIIGGALGLGENVLARADKIQSLSAMTFTHEMARLIVLEQLYRAHSILAGTKYHK
jgi:23S rRNA (pseudouridine1915-N3)-methyltransferase